MFGVYAHSISSSKLRTFKGVKEKQTGSGYQYWLMFALSVGSYCGVMTNIPVTSFPIPVLLTKHNPGSC